MSETKGFFKSEKFYFLLFVLMACAGVIFNLPYAYDKLITYDSSYQYFLTQHSWQEIWRLLPEDYSPPLYAMLLKLSCTIFGHTLKVMMFTNSIVIVGLVFIALFPMRRAFGTRTAIVAAFFFICSTVNSSLFREIRPTYWAYLFLTGTAVYAYLAFFGGKKKDIICHGIFSLLAMYTHNVAMIGVLGIYILLVICSLIKKDRKKFLTFFISGAICGLLYIPWLLIVLKQFGNVKDHYWIAEDAKFSFIKDNLYNIIFFSRFTDSVPMIAESVFSLAIKIIIFIFLIKNLCIKKGMTLADLKKAPLFSKEMRTRYFKGIFVILLLIIPVGAFVILTKTLYPMSAVRYYYIFTGLTIMIISVLCVKLEKKIMPFFLCALTAANAAAVHYDMHKHYTNNASNIERIIEMVETDNPDGDISFLHSHEWTLGVMSYYFPNAKHYMCDGSWTVLNDLTVFPNVPIELGDEDNIKEHTDSFYVFNQSIINSTDEIDLKKHFNEADGFECLYTKGFINSDLIPSRIILTRVKVNDEAEETE